MNTPYREAKVCEKCEARWVFNNAMSPSAASGMQMLVRFTEEEKALMEKLKLETGAASMSEVLRRALRLYGKMMQRMSEGATLVIRDADGKEQTIWMI